MKKFVSTAGWLLLLFFIIGTSGTIAQNLVFQINPEQKRVDGISKGIKPGDTIFIAAGNR